MKQLKEKTQTKNINIITDKALKIKPAKEKDNNFETGRVNYEPDKNNINKMCKLSCCQYADISPSDVGRIVDIIEDGYWIEFTKKFKVYGSNSYIEETRTIFGLAKNIILI